MQPHAARRLLEQTVEQAFDEGLFRVLVRNLFAGNLEELNERARTGNYIFDKDRKDGDKYGAFRENIASLKRIGKFRDHEGEELDVLVVKLRRQENLERARTTQRDFIARYLREKERGAALVAFYTDESPRWRFSLVRLEYRTEQTEAGRVRTTEELTPAKRCSFRVGQDEPSHTALRQLLDLLTRDEPPSLAELEAAFSVEPVTREFFRDYDRIFKTTEAQIGGFGVDEESRWLFTQKLFNRLLFIRFLEKKGWLVLDGREDYLRALWDSYGGNEGLTEHSNFYRDRLRPLFFQGLNIDRSQAGPKERGALEPLIGEIPYLNGELFEPDADDHRDGQQVPDEALQPIFEDLFYVYNFTVSESTPLDVEVAVDPEMLGKVFERLVIQRSEQGSYYTPKTVVAFMCREVLKGYLGGHADLVDRHDASGITIPTGRALLEKLAEIKVVDPACGSGAYLLGMLHELHALYQVLDTRTATARDDYQRKLKIIRDNLYGADLDRFAVNIAQLRLWLSLIVEYEGDAPEPLPNLHFSIGCGDSLTAPDPTGAWNLFHSAAAPIIGRLKRMKGLHQRASGDRKRQLEEGIQREERSLSELLKGAPARGGAFDWRVRFAEVFAEQSPQSTMDGELNLGQTLVAEPQPGGFDIVLANPPYGASVDGGTRDLYFNTKSEEERLQSKDTYGLFMARGLQLLRPGGQLCYIVSDTWRTIKTHRPLRRRILRSSTVVHVLDLPSWIFDATVNTCILTLIKRQTPQEHKLISGDLRGIKNGDWKTLEANLLAVAQQGIDVQTLTYARYTYRQHLIHEYDNLSFFIGSPGLYEMLGNSGLRTLGEVSDVKQGLATADNYYYLRKRPSGHGSYDLLDESKLLRDDEIMQLSSKERQQGVTPSHYQGRHFLPFDKGGASETDEGWLPNYYVPTEYFIDWSRTAVNRLRTATRADVKRRKGEENKITKSDKENRAAVIRNPQYYFREGMTFSPTGIYSPTFRLGCGAVFGNKGSTIFFNDADPRVMLGILTSTTVRYILKVYLSHTVETGEEVLSRLPLPEIGEEDAVCLKTLVNQIIEKQLKDPRYPYHAHEQRKINTLVYSLYGLDPDDVREIELWYARRYPRLAGGQSVLAEIERKYTAHLKRAERVISKPPGYWTSHPVLKLIAEGESGHLEFKETFAVDNETGKKHKEVLNSALKTIAGFLNTDGGTLLVAISDSGEIMGLEKDYSQCPRKNQNADGLQQKLMNLLRDRFEPLPTHGLVNVTFHDFPEGEVMQVDVGRANEGTYLDGEFFVRHGNTTPRLEADDIERWLRDR